MGKAHISDAQGKTKLEDFDVAAINERAVLVFLGTGAWTASKKDLEETRKVTDENDASQGAVKVTKALLPGSEELDAIRKGVSEFRTYHYGVTTSFGRDGWALLPSKKLGEYKSTFLAAREKWEEHLEIFIAKYPELRVKAEKKTIGLGKLFKETDYPPAQDVKSRFRFTTDIRRIRESNNDLLGVSDELREEIIREADARVRKGLASSTEDIAKRLKKFLGNVVEVLSKDNGKAPKIYDTLLGNVKDLAEELPSLDVTDNPVFAQVAGEIHDKLGNLKTEDLKGSTEEAKEKRKEAAKKAKEILNTMGDIF